MAYLPRSCSSRNKGLRPKTRSWASRQGINDGPTLASGALALLQCAWASVCMRKTKVDARDESGNEKGRQGEGQGRQEGGKEGCREVVEPWRGAIPARERRTEPLRFNVQIERSRELLREHRDVEHRRRYRLLRVDARHSTWPRRRTRIRNSTRVVAILVLYFKDHAFKFCFSGQLFTASLYLFITNGIFTKCVLVRVDNPEVHVLRIVSCAAQSFVICILLAYIKNIIEIMEQIKSYGQIILDILNYMV